MSDNQFVRAAQSVIDGIGGKENLQAATHCATRLRLVLKDESKINQKILDNEPMIKGNFLTAGQFQLIIGTGTVNKVFAELIRMTGVQEISKDEAKSLAGEKGNIVQRFVKMLSDIFVPIIPAIVAGGLLMGLNNVFTAKGLIFEGQSLIEHFPQIAGLSEMINTFANAPFVFLPVLIAFSATRIFGGNPFLGAALGMIMVHPDLLNNYLVGTTDPAAIPQWNIFGWDIPRIGYQGTVLPILVLAWVLASLEKFFHKVIPAAVDLLLTPLFALFITAMLTFTIVGPFLRDAGDWLTYGVTWLYETAGPFGSAILGFFYAPIVITGMHNSFIAIETNLLAQIAVTGGTFIFPIAAMSNLAQGGATLGALFCTKDEKLKGIASASGISAVLGITEPAMFGVNLKLRYPFYAAICGAGVAAGFIGIFKVKAVALGAAGIPGIISIKPENVTVFIIGMAIAFSIAFVGTFFLSRTKWNPERALTEQTHVITDDADEPIAVIEAANEVPDNWVMPLQGEVISLAELPDPAFASGAMGAGFGIQPSGGQVVSPVSGTIAAVFPTKHAIGIEADNGLEILIHVGVDTVQLNGEGFSALVKEGQSVSPGTPLLNVDWEGIRGKVPSIVTPVLFTAMDEGQQVEIRNGKPVILP